MESSILLIWEQEPNTDLLNKQIIHDRLYHRLEPVLVGGKTGDSTFQTYVNIVYKITYEGFVQDRISARIRLIYDKIESELTIDFMCDLVEPAHDKFVAEYTNKISPFKPSEIPILKMDEQDMKAQLRERLNR